MQPKSRTLALVAVLVSLWVLFSRVYILLRYGLTWSELDTGSLATVIRSNIESGSVTDSEFTYSGGPAYPLISISVTLVGGIDVIHHQIVLSPILGIVPLLLAYVLYRRLFPEDRWTPLLLLSLLSLFNYFLISTRDGTHDKYSISLMVVSFLALYSLVRSDTGRVPWSLVLIVSLTSLATYNIFVSTALGVVLILGVIIFFVFRPFLRGWGSVQPWRLLRSSAFQIVATAVLVLWIYPPSFRFLRDLHGFLSATILVLLGTSTPGEGPYSVVASAYKDLTAYAFLSAYQWGMIALAFLGWTVISYRLLKARRAPSVGEGFTGGEVHSYAWFSAFGSIGVVSLLADLAVGSHWQIRVFGLGVIFVPVMAVIGIRFVRNQTFRGVLAVCLSLLAVVGTFSLPLVSTGEPLLMNTNPHFIPEEMAAMQWISERGSGSVSDDPNQRLRAAWLLYRAPEMSTSLSISIYPAGDYLILSPVTAERFDLVGSPVFYDNGLSQIGYSRG